MAVLKIRTFIFNVNISIYANVNILTVVKNVKENKCVFALRLDFM